MSDADSRDINLLERSKIHAEVLAPVYNELVAAMGKQEAQALLRRAISPFARAFAGEVARSMSGPGIEKIKFVVDGLADQGLQEVEHLSHTDDELLFHVNGCRAAEYYRDAGLEELGEIILCEIDYEATAILDPTLRLERPCTLMRGGNCCDFRFTRAAQGAS